MKNKQTLASEELLIEVKAIMDRDKIILVKPLFLSSYPNGNIEKQY